MHSQLHAPTLLLLPIIVWIFSKLYSMVRRYVRTTRLNGPPSPSLLFGMSRLLGSMVDPSAIYEEWAEQYGPVYQIPTLLGSKRIVLCDPKAIAHFHAKDSWVYVHTPVSKMILENAVGRGLLWVDGESHKTQRKLLSPAFSNTAIRNLVPVFFRCAHKARTTWDNILDSTPDGEAFIDVQDWMNRITLDGIGLAGFSHDFLSLDGVPSAIATIFDTIGSLPPSVMDVFIFIFGSFFPILGKLPTSRTRLMGQFRLCVTEISDGLLRRAREGKVDGDKSVVELLIRAEDAESKFYMSANQIQAQIALLILAGYETTSINLTWALIELSRYPEVQAKLREELSMLGSTDPSWEQLTNGLPYLDAVVHESLRFHSSLMVSVRVTTQDDVLPLSRALHVASGQTVDHISVAAGTIVSVPMSCINTSTDMWGPRAKEFIPERWLGAEGMDANRAQEIQGHRHLLNFSDGQRMCLGKGFALAEFKAALSVLVRNFTFELPNGPETLVDIQRGILPRPKIAGEKGTRVSLRVRRVGLV